MPVRSRGIGWIRMGSVMVYRLRISLLMVMIPPFSHMFPVLSVLFSLPLPIFTFLLSLVLLVFTLLLTNAFPVLSFLLSLILVILFPLFALLFVVSPNVIPPVSSQRCCEGKN
jgi:hypothetical protein